ncbi:hypothetical protein ACQR35_09895 [Pseudarthrobacter sp. J1738]|uniref:hypothetical protein n=1 Tax=unclassified Pseudarthrobacter TaxID=2647000 RepID=UPI003D2E2297
MNAQRYDSDNDVKESEGYVQWLHRLHSAPSVELVVDLALVEASQLGDFGRER